MFRNETIDVQCNHRSIREFEDREIESERIDALKEVAAHTATSIGMQQSSILRVTDEEQKRQLASIANQEYIARAPELWIFLVDTRRNTHIAKEKGLNTEVGMDADHFLQGFTDAVLMAQNVTVAVESMGMGAVFLGSLLNHAGRVIDVLSLPQGTFPALGMLFGYPAQKPQLKPRMPMEVRFHDGAYRDCASYCESLRTYDHEMNQYYDLRDANRRVDTFTDQVVSKYRVSVFDRCRVFSFAEQNGFSLSASNEKGEE